jgi:hypothetical protein
MTREFSLAAILTATTGRAIVSGGRFGELYELLGFMTGDPPFCHQLPRFCAECAPELLRQHPALKFVSFSEADMDCPEAVDDWLAGQEDRLGETLPVAPLPPGRHVHCNPLVELVEMTGGDKVIRVAAPEDAGEGPTRG